MAHAYYKRPINLDKVAQQLSKELKVLENDFSELTSDKNFINRFVTSTYTGQDLNKMLDKPYNVLVYIDNQLKFWSDNTVVLPEEELTKKYVDGVSFAKIANGYYQVIKQPWQAANDSVKNIHIVGLQLLRTSYEKPNKYLVNQSPSYLSLPEEITLSIGKAGVDAVVVNKTRNTKPLFVDHTSLGKERKGIYWDTFLQLAAIFLMLLFATTVANKIAEQRNILEGFTFLIFIFALLRLMMWYGEIPIGLKKMALFDTSFYETTSWFQTPGSLLLLSSAWLWIIVFAHKKINISLVRFKSQLSQNILYMFLIGLLVALSFGVAYLIKVLVIDFGTSLALSDIISDANYITVSGLFTLTFLCLGLFFWFQKVASLIEQLNLSVFDRLLGLSLVCIMGWMAYKTIDFQETYYLLMVGWFLAFGLLTNTYGDKSFREVTTGSLVYWSITFSFFAALIVYNFSWQKERQNREDYARSIAKQEDSVTEFWFEDAATEIMIKDGAIKHYYYGSPLLMKEQELVTRIKQKHLKKHFDKYDINVIPFNNDGNPLRDLKNGWILSDYEYQINFNSIHTNNHYLHLMANQSGGYNYLAKLPVFDSEVPGPIGYMIIEMIPKSDKQTNVYPELIIEDGFRQPAAFRDYSYAVYSEGRLESSEGIYAYNSQQEPSFPFTSDSLYLKQNEYTHFIYNTLNVRDAAGDKKRAKTKVGEEVGPKTEKKSKLVVVSYNANDFFSLLALFSYFFVLTMFGLVLGIGLTYLFRRNASDLRLNGLFLTSLSKRINASMLILITTAFFVIGGATGYFFYNRSANYHKRILAEKEREILASIENVLHKRQNTSKKDRKDKRSAIVASDVIPASRLNEVDVVSLSKIHQIDINIYDDKGALLSYSQPVIFNKDLVSKNMNTLAFYELSKMYRSQFIQKEKIGELGYMSAYVPITNKLGNQTLGYLNIPYFEQAKQLRKELSSFLATIVNLYMLLWIGSSVLALLVSKSITNPLRMISDKLGTVEIGQQNELLTWPHEDEIGKLVDQYNTTIEKLEHSVKMLAQAERKYAWEQMARQVAHEIKNPLTPMKLSVQHLQRANRQGHPNISDMTDRVAQTLIEQIDTLSRIASEFHDFAQMPKPNNEVINIKDVVLNAVTLFEDMDGVQIYKLLPEESCYVYADKNHLLRVFNNLIKNAIQAIPDERQGMLVVNMRKTGSYIVIGVADNGTGIDSEKAEKVFVPNFTTKNSGMGLGLAMARNIVETAKGRIWFETEVGEGTTFFVKLPLETVDDTDYAVPSFVEGEEGE